MNGLCSYLIFAANRLSAASNSDSDFDIYWWVIAALIVIAFIAACFAYNRIRKIQANGHYALFRGLCRLHGLDSNSKRLLRDIALHYNIDKPVRLFLEPSWLDQIQSKNDISADTVLINELKAKLFG
jgi:hypothetical protein